MKLLVVYDVSDDSKRSKLANNLKKLGLERIQRSAFEGDIDSQRVKDLIRIVRLIVDTSTDIVHIIPLGVRDWERRIVIGKEGLEEWLV
ncbi:CRISPR-associated endonuclease Cas2 [Saccharolobus islandicus]|uniref:CRISPR-associated endoribonuclease Cas2 n=2 Tax=Saccharolobus islandicus TaxID=43080 RepID=C3MX11_SACI4|nr:CRISPR-associated endonuclease Cas2 [Sulfolobus islandicus]ACP37691.1 CRISPR-associated protein Cas2 [Sulfolobus islandicus M.14.25]ACP54887.1 CRISPR-associated protein Cas2 [Sulfolobus islandicus M.16.27]